MRTPSTAPAGSPASRTSHRIQLHNPRNGGIIHVHMSDCRYCGCALSMRPIAVDELRTWDTWIVLKCDACGEDTAMPYEIGA